MSLGAGALKFSGGPNAISREEVSMVTLKAGTTPTAATNWHRHTEYLPKRIRTWENAYQTTRQGGSRGSENPQWFARRQELICYDQQAKLQCKATLAKGHTRSPAIPRGPPRRSQTEVGEDRWPTRSSLTLPEWYLATCTANGGKFEFFLLLVILS